MTNARVLTFHIDDAAEDDLVEALDEEAARLSQCHGFGGLLCLKQRGVRDHIMVITLWDDEGLAATQLDHERSKKHIASTTDLGVMSQTHEVLHAHFGGIAEGFSVHNSWASEELRMCGTSRGT